MSTATIEPDTDETSATGSDATEFVGESFGARARRDTYATAYRLRRQIMPHAVTGLIMGSGFAAHAICAAGGASPVAASLTLAGVSAPAAIGVVKRVRSRRRRWARRVTIGAAGAALWLAASPFGVGPLQAAELVCLEVLLAARWWQVNRLGYPDLDQAPAVPEPEIDDRGWTVREQTELDWRLWVACQGGPLPEARLTFVEETKHALVFDLLLHRGKQSLTTAIAALDKIASGLDVEIDSLVIESHPLMRSLARCRFQILTDSPIKGDVDFDGPRRDGGILWLGPFADGVGEAPWRLYTDGSMWSGVIIGGTGIGKSRLVENIIISALSGGDTEYWFVDPQRGASSPALRDHADFFRPMDGVDELLDAALAILDGRGEENAVFDWMGFTPSPQRPGIIIVIDEAHVPLADKKRAAKVSRIAREGRKVGMCVILIDQDPSIKTFGNDEALRSSVMEGNAVVLRSTSNTTGQLMPGLLVDPKTLPKMPGYAYVQGSPELGTRTAPFRNRNTAPSSDPDEKVEQVRRWLVAQPRPGLDRLAQTATLAAGTFYRDRNNASTSGRSAAAERIRAMRDGILPDAFQKRTDEPASAVGEMGEIIHFPEFSWNYGQQDQTGPISLSSSHRAVLAAVEAGASRPREVEDATGLRHRRVAELLKELVDYELLRQPSYGRYERAA